MIGNSSKPAGQRSFMDQVKVHWKWRPAILAFVTLVIYLVADALDDNVLLLGGLWQALQIVKSLSLAVLVILIVTAYDHVFTIEEVAENVQKQIQQSVSSTLTNDLAEHKKDVAKSLTELGQSIKERLDGREKFGLVALREIGYSTLIDQFQDDRAHELLWLDTFSPLDGPAVQKLTEAVQQKKKKSACSSSRTVVTMQSTVQRSLNGDLIQASKGADCKGLTNGFGNGLKSLENSILI